MNSTIPLAGRKAAPGVRRGGASRKLIALLAAAILSVGIGYVGYYRFLGSAPAPAPLQTAVARTGPLVSTVASTGSVIATRQAKLGFPASGRLAELKVAVGDSVKAGQQLAKLDSTALEAKVNQAESSLRVARIKLEQMKQGATPEEVAAAEAAYKSALAKYKDTTAAA